MRWPIIATWACLALLGNACTLPGSSDAAESTSTTRAAATPVPTTIQPVPQAPVIREYPEIDADRALFPDDQLVVQRANAIVLITRQGENDVAVAEDGIALSQPVFSGDGSELVWSESAGPFASRIVRHNIESQEEQPVDTPFTSYYSSWDSDSNTLAFLGDSPQGGTGLGVVEFGRLGAFEAEATLTPVGSARPFFFDWSEDGSRMLAHTGSGLSLIELDQQQTVVLRQVSDSFQVPIWLPGEETGAVAIDAGPTAPASHELVAYNIADETVDSFFPFEGRIVMDLSPDGTALAVGIIAPVEAGPAPVSLRQQEQEQDPDAEPQDPEAEPEVQGGGVIVLDLESREITRLTETPPLAVQWSPDGSRILVLEVAADQSAFDDQDQGVAVRWLVIEREGQASATAEFVLSRAFATNYVPFYDQYAKSATLWSADSTRVAFPGTAPSGQTGIWVFEPNAEREMILLTEGDLAFWSPQ